MLFYFSFARCETTNMVYLRLPNGGFLFYALLINDASRFESFRTPSRRAGHSTDRRGQARGELDVRQRPRISRRKGNAERRSREEARWPRQLAADRRLQRRR